MAFLELFAPELRILIWRTIIAASSRIISLHYISATYGSTTAPPRQAPSPPCSSFNSTEHSDSSKYRRSGQLRYNTVLTGSDDFEKGSSIRDV